MEALNQTARDVLDGNRYLILGTVDDDGRPRTSPVYFNHASYRDFYWVSSPNAHHSHNVAGRPRVSFVVFDSSVRPADAPQAVYVDAEAAEVTEPDLAEHCARAFAQVRDDGARAFAPEELSGDADLRLYRARATRHQVHVRGRMHPSGVDARETVEI
jgi:nitroimidazol reductase NimA-like FMN-containing flavoprotein (pyridoxamine 5'-phosphate oxidase superfamily)